jgi:hypothetical protein
VLSSRAKAPSYYPLNRRAAAEAPGQHLLSKAALTHHFLPLLPQRGLTQSLFPSSPNWTHASPLPDCLLSVPRLLGRIGSSGLAENVWQLPCIQSQGTCPCLRAERTGKYTSGGAKGGDIRKRQC